MKNSINNNELFTNCVNSKAANRTDIRGVHYETELSPLFRK